MSKDKLFVSLIKKTVGLPTGPSSCACAAGSTPAIVGDCCDKGASPEASPCCTASEAVSTPESGCCGSAISIEASACC